MRVEVVQHHQDAFCLGMDFAHQPFHDLGEIPLGSPRPHRHMPAAQRT